MTPEQKRIVKETWQQVAPIGHVVTERFYRRLFDIDGSTRALFRNTDMPEQRGKLVQAFGTAIQGLDRLEALLPVIEGLGRRHAGYGVTDEHYDSVGKALLATLEEGLGASWTAAAAEAWAELYGTLSAVMQRAARESISGTPAIGAVA